MGKKKTLGIILATGAIIPASMALASCGHKHSYDSNLKSDATQHWEECSCGDKKNAENHEAATNYSHNETHHWKDCTECGYDLTVEAHTFDQEVADEACFVSENETTVTYNKSCVCGQEGTETFVVNKIVATLENVAMSAVEIIYGEEYGVNFSSNSTGTVAYEWYQGSTQLNQKPTDAGTYKVKVKIAGNRAYTPVESDLIEFEIKPVVLSNVQTTVEYNGTMYHFKNFDNIVDGLRIDWTFNSANVGATLTSYVLTLNAEETNNYVLDQSTCSIEIVQKEVSLEWIAPNLNFDMMEKVPTVAVAEEDLCEDDECVVTIIKREGDNRWYGSSFTYEATGLSNDNYKLSANVISPEYTIADIAQMEVETELLVYQYIPYGAPSYLKINLEEGDYVFNFEPDDQGSNLAIEIYKKGDYVNEIVEKILSWQNGEEVAFKIAEAGEYVVKCNQVNDFEPQYDTIKIYVDEHTTPNTYGFCDKGCGTYLGEELITNSWETVTLESGKMTYFRFEDGGDVKYNIRYFNSDGNGLIVKLYRTDNEGNFIEVSLSGEPSMYEASFDGYYYLTFRYSALASAPDKEFNFCIEETLNN